MMNPEEWWNWVTVSKIFLMFTPKIGEDEPILTIIFQNGLDWNHQLDSNAECL